MIVRKNYSHLMTLVAAGAAVAIAEAGCSSSDGGTGASKVCAPGDSKTCACPAGVEGAQTCKEDGSGWGTCEGCTGTGGSNRTSGGATSVGTGGATATGGANAAAGGTLAATGGTSTTTSGGSNGEGPDASIDGTGGASAGGSSTSSGGTSGTGAAPGTGGTVVGGCTPGALQCSGLTPQTCGANGTWTNGAACPYSCVSGACAGTCTPTSKQCNGNAVETCSTTGTWGLAVGCVNQACAAGTCSGVCTPTATRCLGNGVQTCDATGAWPAAVDCPTATPLCGGAGVCGVPKSCSGNLAETCGSGGNQNCCSSAVVPGGTFNRSNDLTYPATVSTFRLDDFEVTVGRFRKFVGAYQQSLIPAGKGANPNNAGDAGWSTSWNASLPLNAAALKTALVCDASYATWTDTAGTGENQPINCLDWYTAYAFCAWDGGRLPTEAEWNYAAAGGTNQRAYPWGSAAPGANTTDANYGCYHSTTPGTCTGSVNIARVGLSSAGVAKYGQQDMAGNVNEWNQDFYQIDYSNPCVNCADLSSHTFSVLRGGSFKDVAADLLTSSRQNLSSTVRDYTIGVRCARSE